MQHHLHRGACAAEACGGPGVNRDGACGHWPWLLMAKRSRIDRPWECPGPAHIISIYPCSLLTEASSHVTVKWNLPNKWQSAVPGRADSHAWQADWDTPSIVEGCHRSGRRYVRWSGIPAVSGLRCAQRRDAFGFTVVAASLLFHKGDTRSTADAQGRCRGAHRDG